MSNANIYTKLFELQKRIKPIKKDSTNPYFNSKYFDINTLIDTLKTDLQAVGLMIMQPLTNVNGRPAIKTVIFDSTGQIEDITVLPDLPDPQKMGSAITYYRRYALQSLLFLEADDDDGNVASAKPDFKPVAKPTTKPTKPVQTNDVPFP